MTFGVREKRYFFLVTNCQTDLITPPRLTGIKKQIKGIDPENIKLTGILPESNPCCKKVRWNSRKRQPKNV
ncbi:MAG: hypothetical protein U0586_11200 [Candidatus Brocadiaceae bacterium]